MKHIYVDYSVRHDNKGYGGVAVLIKDQGELTTRLYQTPNIRNDQGELVALLMGLKYANVGDVVCTDQDFIVDHILEHGEVRLGKHNTNIPNRKRKLVHSLNTVLTLKKGVAIVGVQRGHCGTKEWGHVDGFAKVAAGVRCLCHHTWRHFEEHLVTTKTLAIV